MEQCFDCQTPITTTRTMFHRLQVFFHTALRKVNNPPFVYQRVKSFRIAPSQWPSQGSDRLKVWDLSTDDELSVLSGRDHCSLMMGDQLTVVVNDGAFKVFQGGLKPLILKCCPEDVLAVSSDRRYGLLFIPDGNCQVWDLHDQLELRTNVATFAIKTHTFTTIDAFARSFL